MSRRKSYFFLAVALIVLLSISQAHALITVTSVQGQAAYKAQRQWIPVRKGINLPEGSKVSTGVKSYVVLQLDDHLVTIKPFTMLKIYEHKKDRLKERTRLGLRRGSIRAKVKRKKRVSTIFKVSTPVATSSVRGTEEEIWYGPSRGMIIKVIEGEIEGKNKAGNKRYIYGELAFHQTPTDGLPAPLLKEIKDLAFTHIYDTNITNDEKTSREQNSDTTITGSGNEDIVDYIDDRATTTHVNVHIEW
jgi:hypothetical protein